MEKNKWLIEQILNKNKIEYGTPEYWEKERKSKFRINARQREEQLLKMDTGIIMLWSTVVSTEMPLYNLMNSQG